MFRFHNIITFFVLFISPSWVFCVSKPINEFTSSNGYNDCNFFTNGEHAFLRSYLKPNTKVIFDVGANIGDWSKMASRYAPNAKIYAFEPHPKIFKMLSKNFPSKKVVCVPFALSNHQQEALLWVWGEDADTEKSGLNGLHYRPILKDMFNKEPFSIEIFTLTLDSFCEENGINRIDYLKIDTEGNELAVLEGSDKMLSNGNINVIQFEYGGCYIDSKTTLENVYRLLKKHNYKVFRILPDKLFPITDWSSGLENFQYSNYVAILSAE